MLQHEDYDADEILREDEEGYDGDEIWDDDPVEELDFESGSPDSYGDMVSDLDQADDLWE